MGRSSVVATLLRTTSCVLLLSTAGVVATRAVFDLRAGEDFRSDTNCADPETKRTHYLHVEVFDYNQTPDLAVTWRQTTDECGIPINDGFEATMLWDKIEIVDFRHLTDIHGHSTLSSIVIPLGLSTEMDMYVCAPWGDYELIIASKSTNGGNATEKIAWVVEYGPEEYHIWDTHYTPFFTEEPASDYAPVPDGSGSEQIFKYPLDGAKGYYSVIYSGPFPPLHCPNLYPVGVDYVGCFDAGLFGAAENPSGSANTADPAEPYRLLDGIDDDGVDADMVMTLEKCASICTEQGTKYFGLESAVKCLCGDELDGSLYPDVFGEGGSVCGIDYTNDINIPEYKFLCSGESRVLCGTDTHISVYSLDSNSSPPSPVVEPGSPSSGYSYVDCFADNEIERLMEVGPMNDTTMSAEICLDICLDLDPTYTHFGTQFSIECFCTSDLGIPTNVTGNSTTSCDMPCVGNEDEICGGFYALSVYEIDDLPSPAPAPANTSEPATPGAGEGFASLGCYADMVDDRIMGSMIGFSSFMTAELCFILCNNGNHTHFGTQAGTECFCAALSDVESIEKHGDELPASTHCLTVCAGDSGETCGGFEEMNVYEITGETDPVMPEEEYTPLGCYPDDKNARVMEVGKNATTMSAEICFETCVEEDTDYIFFGTQWGIECWCSKTFSEPSADDDCDIECEGNAPEICDRPGYHPIASPARVRWFDYVFVVLNNRCLSGLPWYRTDSRCVTPTGHRTGYTSELKSRLVDSDESSQKDDAGTYTERKLDLIPIAELVPFVRERGHPSFDKGVDV